MTPCIEHTQRGDKNGYGTTTRIRYGVRHRVILHRAVYVDNRGCSWEDIRGLVIRHKCDNPRCINPAHLETGEPKDNTRDMMERGRHYTPRRDARPDAKLSSEQVAEIVKRYIPRSRTNSQQALAKEYGVSQQLISTLVRG